MAIVKYKNQSDVTYECNIAYASANRVILFAFSLLKFDCSHRLRYVILLFRIHESLI